VTACTYISLLRGVTALCHVPWRRHVAQRATTLSKIIILSAYSDRFSRVRYASPTSRYTCRFFRLYRVLQYKPATSFAVVACCLDRVYVDLSIWQPILTTCSILTEPWCMIRDGHSLFWG